MPEFTKRPVNERATSDFGDTIIFDGSKTILDTKGIVLRVRASIHLFLQARNAQAA